MPANETYWRSLKKMHVIFAISAVGLLLVTLGMMWKDHKDEWRGYQKTFDRIEELRILGEIEADRTDEYTQRITDLEADLEKAKAEYEKAKLEYENNKGEDEPKGSIDEDIAAKELELDLVNRALRNQRAVKGKASADRDLAVRDEKPESVINALQDNFNAESEKVDELEIQVQNFETELTQLKNIKSAMREQVSAIEADLKNTQAEIVRLEATKEKIAPDSWFSRTKRDVMQWPIIDAFNSPHKIKQVWLPDLKVTLGMAQTARFDRCQTCHLGIDRVEAGNLPSFPHGVGADFIPSNHPSEKDIQAWVNQNKFPHPYSTHPRPDLFLASNSPHPTQEFGCTICHDGQGSGTSFDNAAHTPNNPHENEHWAEKYHYHPNHFWEYPMQPERFRESTCLKCHHDVVDLGASPKFGNSAPKVVKGFETIQTFGCFGCHEIHGKDGEKSLGPDLRLEPNHFAVALAIGNAAKTTKNPANDAKGRLDQILRLADKVANNPEDTAGERRTLQQLVLADKGLQTPLFGKRIHELAAELKDNDNPGKYRKVGPSLRHINKKTTPGWLEHWTMEPKKFRPSTRMPQFFHLTNQHDDPTAEKFMPVQVAAVQHYLMSKSQEVELLSPAEDYKPDADKGKVLFSEKGCLACHSHKDFPDIHMDFGPNLDKVYAKVKSGQDGFNWLYSWIRDPHRYHKRTKMPNLFLEPTSEGDPAADIAAFLLKAPELAKAEGEEDDNPVEEYNAENTDDVTFKSSLDELVFLNLSGKSLTKAATEKLLKSGKYPVSPDKIKGDEIELALDDKSTWQEKKLNYIGRRTITQYGCYGCHDIPGFEAAKPIGTALQDWGRKDTSRLAFEHITEFLHHHNTPGSDTTLTEQVEQALKRAKSNEFKTEEEAEKELSKAFYYESIQHHGRAGFIWQKLRQPRSYDYEKIKTKRYDERLLMPKFPLEDDQIEAVATFVLGLTAEPPAEKYLFKPTDAPKARFEGEALLKKYNCTSCHMLELPEITYAVGPRITENMTLDEIIQWFVDNRANLVAGKVSELPADITTINTLCQTFRLDTDAARIARLADVQTSDSGRKISAKAAEEQYRKNLSEWFGQHPEVLLLKPLDKALNGEFPDGIRALLKLKPPEIGDTGLEDDEGNKLLRFHGMGELKVYDEENQEYSYDVWNTLDIGGRIMLPKTRIIFPPEQMVNQNSGRGGVFTEWLADKLAKSNNPEKKYTKDEARQASPPPLVLEGLKVQTPWLYQFLKNPEQLRHLTVLRMPRFNMSDAEARALANYFAAVDDADYPYQDIPQRDPAYITRKNELYEEKYPEEYAKQKDYLEHSWNLFGNMASCRSCHSVLGAPLGKPLDAGAAKADPAKPAAVMRGPDLSTRVTSRLRPGYLQAWIHAPNKVLPYTSMVTPNTAPTDKYFKKEPEVQIEALVDALMNLNPLLQKYGKITPSPAPNEDGNKTP